jgi:hypothetical protein
MLNDYPEIKLARNIFPYAIGVTDWDSNVLSNDTMFDLEVLYHQYKTDKDGVFYELAYTPLELEPCQFSHFPGISEELYKLFNIDIYLCPKNDNMTVACYWSDSFNYFEIKVSFCKGDSCSPDEEVVEYFSSNKLNLALTYLEPAVDYTDFDSPVKNGVTSKYIYANKQMYKYMEFALSKNYIDTDIGYFLDDVQTEYFYQLELIIPSDPIDIDPSDRTLISFGIVSNNKYSAYYRKYIKIPEVIAAIGGLLNILTISFSLINLPFARLNKQFVLINELVNIDEVEKRSRIVNTKLVSNKHLSSFNGISSSKNIIVHNHGVAGYYPRNSQSGNSYTRLVNILTKEEA